MPPQTNLERLEQAGIARRVHGLNERDEALIESLTPAEVDSLIAIAQKLGVSFFQLRSGHPTAGILF